MQIIEVTNARDAQRARCSQYSGLDQTFILGDQTVSGVVLTVSPIAGVQSDRWTIKIRPTPERKPMIRSKSYLRRR